MNKMKEALSKQRSVIMQLEKMFETRQIDKEMNNLLKKEEERLMEMKKNKNNNLQAVYNIVKGHNNGKHSIKEK